MMNRILYLGGKSYELIEGITTWYAFCREILGVEPDEKLKNKAGFCLEDMEVGDDSNRHNYLWTESLEEFKEYSEKECEVLDGVV